MVSRDEPWCPHMQHRSPRKDHALLQRLVPIVFIFTVSEKLCKWGLFDYLKFSVEQAVTTQKGAPVILASNFGACAKSAEVLGRWNKDILKVDTLEIASTRTKLFSNMTGDLFMANYMPELWGGAALRFFILEDIMSRYNYTELIHVEGDNMIYGDYQELVPLFRTHYPGLAATPLTKNLLFITASVLWIGNPLSLHYFNNFLLNLGTKSGSVIEEMKATNRSGTSENPNIPHSERTPNKHSADRGRNLSDWDGYVSWMKPHACCVKWGIAHEKNGDNGLKPFAVNEMSMLGYYHHMLSQLDPAAFAFKQPSTLSSSSSSSSGATGISARKHITSPCPREFQLFPTVPSNLSNIAKELSLRLDLLELRFAALPIESNATLAYKNKNATTASTPMTATMSAPGSTNTERTSKPASTAGAPLVGVDTLGGIYDPNSWGQHLGGTFKKKGKDRGFTDKSHILFEVIWHYGCRARMACSRNTLPLRLFNLTLAQLPFTASTTNTTGPEYTQKVFTVPYMINPSAGSNSLEMKDVSVCYTAPHVQCGHDLSTPIDSTVHTKFSHTLLWNLHVHSKQTALYRSLPCDCRTAV